jgi:hypothetical protein
MSDPARTHSDGVLVFGSQVVTINSVNYVADSISIDEDTKVLEAMNQSGVVNKDVMIETPRTGSLTLQLLVATDPRPGIAKAVNIFPVGANTANAGEALAFKIKKVGQAFQQDGETKVTCDIREKFN